MMTDVGDVDVARVALAAERLPGEIHVGDQVVDDPGADMGRLRLHLLHQPWALDDVGETRIILDIGGDHELAAGLHAGHQDRRQVGARGIDRGGVASGSGADDQDLGVMRLRSCPNISVRARLRQARRPTGQLRDRVLRSDFHATNRRLRRHCAAMRRFLPLLVLVVLAVSAFFLLRGVGWDSLARHQDMLTDWVGLHPVGSRRAVRARLYR